MTLHAKPACPCPLLTPAKVVGWKNYAVAALCFAASLWAFKLRDYDGAVKGFIAGLLVISLRDVLGKVLASVCANREATDGLRAAIETELSTRKGTL